MILSLVACAAPSGEADGNGTDSASQNAGSDAQPSGDAADSMKILVVYFSVTNTTEGIAKDLADNYAAMIVLFCAFVYYMAKLIRTINKMRRKNL